MKKLNVKSLDKSKLKYALIFSAYALVIIGLIIFTIFVSGAFVKSENGAKGSFNFVEYKTNEESEG